MLERTLDELEKRRRRLARASGASVGFGLGPFLVISARAFGCWCWHRPGSSCCSQLRPWQTGARSEEAKKQQQKKGEVSFVRRSEEAQPKKEGKFLTLTVLTRCEAKVASRLLQFSGGQLRSSFVAGSFSLEARRRDGMQTGCCS